MTVLDWLAIGVAAITLLLWGGIAYRLTADWQHLNRIRRNRRP